MDELARQLGIDPFDLRAAQRRQARRPMLSHGRGPIRPDLRQLRARPVPRPRRARRWRAATARRRRTPRLADRRGHGAGHDRHHAAARPLADAHDLAATTTAATTCPSAPPSSATAPRTVHGQIAATALATTVDRIALRQSDTDAWRPRHRRLRQRRHRRRGHGHAWRPRSACDRHCSACAAELGVRRRERARSDDDGVRLRRPAHVLCGAREAARERGHAARSARGTSDGTPRSVAFNVQGFRVAVNMGTGEVRILKSVQAADAGPSPTRCSAAARSRAASRRRSAPRSTRRW